MNHIKNELQNIILGDGQACGSGKLKKTQAFLRRNAQASKICQSEKSFKRQEEARLNIFAESENLIYEGAISASDYLTSGAEQHVYRFDNSYVIKLNDSIFYESWLDYFNSLLVHNFFFESTAYDFLGFTTFNGKFSAVVKQQFISDAEPANLKIVMDFLAFNSFENTRRNDYINKGLGLIFEDLHDENVLVKNDILYFIDTIFYLTDDFYSII